MQQLWNYFSCKREESLLSQPAAHCFFIFANPKSKKISTNITVIHIYVGKIPCGMCSIWLLKKEEIYLNYFYVFAWEPRNMKITFQLLLLFRCSPKIIFAPKNNNVLLNQNCHQIRRMFKKVTDLCLSISDGKIPNVT